MIGSFLGAKLASLPFITDTFQLILFSVMMLLAAILMIKKGEQKLEKAFGYFLIAVSVFYFSKTIVHSFINI